MKKLIGGSLVLIGGGAIAGFLLRGTKYDFLTKLKITNPVAESSIQKSFDCEYLNYKLEEAKGKLQSFMYLNKDDFSYKGNDQAIIDRINKDLIPTRTQLQKDVDDKIRALKPSNCIDMTNYTQCITEADKNTDYCKSIENTCETLNQQVVSQQAYIDSAQKTWDLKQPNLLKMLNTAKAELTILQSKLSKCDKNGIDCYSINEDIKALSLKNDTYSIQQLAYKKALFNLGNCANKPLVRQDIKFTDFIACMRADEEIKRLNDVKVKALRYYLDNADQILAQKNYLLENASVLSMDALNAIIAQKEMDFANSNCRDRIEAQRLKDTAVISVEKQKEQEGSILKKNFQEQYAYIGLGSLVLLTGFYIVIKR